MTDQNFQASDKTDPRTDSPAVGNPDLADPIETLKALNALTETRVTGSPGLPQFSLTDRTSGQAKQDKDQPGDQQTDRKDIRGGPAPVQVDTNLEEGSPRNEKTSDFSHNKDVQEAHRKLSDAAEKKLDGPGLAEFQKNMEDFEKRASHHRLDPKEISETYRQVERMLDAEGDKPLPETDRLKLASQIMQHAAHPAIDQGNHETCNVTTIESRTYTRTPSEAARLVSDVALTGQYVTHDGTVVKGDPPPKDDEASQDHTINGKRDYASEIFQVTAVNLHYQKENPNYRYEQLALPPPQSLHDTGERLLDYSDPGHPKEVLGDNGNPVRQPALCAPDIAQIANAISGKNDQDFVISSDSFGSCKDVFTVKSEAELDQKLSELKVNRQLPVIVQVFCANEPFHQDSNGGKIDDDGGHVVTVTDYKPGPPGQAFIQNQWGRQADHPVSVHDLYKATRPTEHSWMELQKDVDWNREKGRVDYFKEFELLEAKKMAGKINESDYEQFLVSRMKGMKAQFERNHIRPEEQERDRIKMSDAMDQLSGAALIRVVAEQHKAGLTDEKRYENYLAVVALQARYSYNNEVAAKDPQAEGRYNDARVALTEALSQMTREERHRVLNQLVALNKQYLSAQEASK